MEPIDHESKSLGGVVQETLFSPGPVFGRKATMEDYEHFSYNLSESQNLLVKPEKMKNKFFFSAASFLS
jgi:hypothetical protein